MPAKPEYTAIQGPSSKVLGLGEGPRLGLEKLKSSIDAAGPAVTVRASVFEEAIKTRTIWVITRLLEYWLVRWFGIEAR